MTDSLKLIEARHQASNATAGYCPECHSSPPCDVVKLARALDGVAEDGCANMGPCSRLGYPQDDWCWPCRAERALSEVAGGE